jgi:hypothetical protein
VSCITSGVHCFCFLVFDDGRWEEVVTGNRRVRAGPKKMRIHPSDDFDDSAHHGEGTHMTTTCDGRPRGAGTLHVDTAGASPVACTNQILSCHFFCLSL